MHYDKIFKSEDYEWVLFIHGFGGSYIELKPIQQ